MCTTKNPKNVMVDVIPDSIQARKLGKIPHYRIGWVHGCHEELSSIPNSKIMTDMVDHIFGFLLEPRIAITISMVILEILKHFSDMSKG